MMLFATERSRVTAALESSEDTGKALALGDGLRYFGSVFSGSRQLRKIGHNNAQQGPMVVIYAGSFPPDPETDLKNFQRKQAEYEAAYRCTGGPLALYEALLNAGAYLQFPADLNWLVEAVGDIIMRDRTDQTARRFRERMRHVRRYRVVRDLRRSHSKDRALDSAVAALEATGDAAARSTLEDSYDRVERDLKQAGRESEYFFLVARGDPTVVPVIVSQTQLGTTINGVLQSPGVTPSPAVTRGDS
jgi:hypothetical protein